MVTANEMKGAATGKTGNARQETVAPASGERNARLGYGYQDKSAAERIVRALKDELRHGGSRLLRVKLADVNAGRVDDIVLVWEDRVEGNSIKWRKNQSPVTWGYIVGADGLLKELASGFLLLKEVWPGYKIKVRLQTNFPAAETTHGKIVSGISVARFLEDHWQDGPKAEVPERVQEAWRVVESHTGLSGEGLDEFVGACDFSLGESEQSSIGPDTEDARQYLKQVERLHDALATWIAKFPDSEFVDREYLMTAIGLQSYQSELVQKFPSPQIPYQRNQAAASELRRLLHTQNGGYVAVTGCAGVGKSTLVQDVVDVEKRTFLVPYFAFLPYGQGNSRDRGEAMTFFRNVVARLDSVFPGRRSLGIDSIIHGRDALRYHMAQANKEFIATGRKTVLLIDGLDHVAREVGLQESVLLELPSPAEIPDGFLIVLSARPEALLPDNVGPAVSNAVILSSDRQIVVDGLSRSEVHQIVAKAVGGTSEVDRDQVYYESAGNPLILTYLLNIVHANSTGEVVDAIKDATKFDGDIDRFYAEALASSLQDAGTRRLLGLLCRAAPLIPVAWLRRWPEKNDVEDLYKRVLAPFTREDDGNLSFIHNSLISFLVERTRSVLPGADYAAEERDFYSELADRSRERSCSDPLGRAHVFYLARADRGREVLKVATSAWLRESVQSFVPYELIRPIVLEATGLAWGLGEFGDVVRLILLDSELHQRSGHLDAEELCDAFLNFGEHELALAQLQANGRLLVKDDVALNFSRKVWFYARARNSHRLNEVSKKLYEDAKPIRQLLHGDPVVFGSYERATVDSIRAWSSTAPLFERIEDVIDQIGKLDIAVETDEREVDVASVRARFLFNSLRTAVRANLRASIEKLLLRAIVSQKKPDWELAALLLCAREGATPVSKSSLLDALSHCEDQPYQALSLAEHLYTIGDHDSARAIVESLSDTESDTNSRSGAGVESIDLAFHSSLWCLREELGLGESPERTIESDRDEALARVEIAARRLGKLRSQATRGEKPNELRRKFRDVLLYESRVVERPIQHAQLEPSAIGSRWAIFDELLDVAKSFGDSGMIALRDVVLEVAKSSPEFLGVRCRHFAMAFHASGVLAKSEAIKLALSFTLDANEDDPRLRQQACLEVAGCLSNLDADDWREWLHRAGRASAGAGSHKDYRMADLAVWLNAALADGPITARGIEVLEKFTRALEAAGGAGQFDAVDSVLGIMVRAMPSCAAPFAVEMVDRGLVTPSTALKALVAGGMRAGVSPHLLSAIFEELLSLVATDGVGPLAASIVEAAPRSGRRRVADRLMSHVRTNSLPSTRVEIARSVQDALARSGFGVIDLTEGLPRHGDDASNNRSLYKLADGHVLTTEQVAARLRSASRRDEWDPNPAENAEFDWWEVIRKAGPLDIARLEAVQAHCPTPEYRKAEYLALRSIAFREHGCPRKARETADAAVEVAAGHSWFAGYDGGQRQAPIRALWALDPEEARERSRKTFGEDLASGNLDRYFLMLELVGLFELMEIPWPTDQVLNLIDEYVEEVLGATGPVDPYHSFHSEGTGISSDEAVCRFLIGLFAFPGVDTACAARRAFSSYLARTTCPYLSTLLADCGWNDTELEYILSAIDVASQKNPKLLDEALRSSVQTLSRHESLAVRSVARRICSRARWDWIEVRNQERRSRIYVPSDIDGWTLSESEMLVHGDVVSAWRLFRANMLVLENAGVSREDLKSEFEILYSRTARDYRWSDRQKVRRWTKFADSTLRPRVLIGRTAAMRLLGRYALEGVGPAEAENSYDVLRPLYDPALELMAAAERPPEFRALDWGFMDEREQEWANGVGADDWVSYPQKIGDHYVIGEVSFFTRSDRDKCCETRVRGVLGIEATKNFDESENDELLSAGRDLTQDLYRQGFQSDSGRVVARNKRGLLAGPIYRWPALNARLAEHLGWKPSPTDPFGWLGPKLEPVVKSVFWRDGDIGLTLPRSDSLGAGWCLLATEGAVQAVRQAVEGATVHLLVERERRGASKRLRSWRLRRKL